ncbi:MAG: CpaD family pilus assembly lipoprotein [Holosporaceae bacterium]|jgi:type IV pilus biogenesis protein CpaD/CtpE|nr:CpaD family pilus assembly lipoprotein [Holosporaceae bacterium]
MRGKNFLNCILLGSLLAMVGCEKQYKANDAYVSDVKSLRVSENRRSKFFELNNNFELSENSLLGIKKVLRDAKGEGIDNISFVIISNRPMGIAWQEKIRSIVQQYMYEAGFLDSRIIDSGLCIYSGAKPGVRLDVLQYNVEEPDCGRWTEYVGDMDTNKGLPRFGASDACNLGAMIGNSADLINPRNYKGQKTSEAMKAAASSGSGSSGGSSSSS